MGPGWLRQRWDGQKEGSWILKIPLTELSVAEEGAPGFSPVIASAHFPSQPTAWGSRIPVRSPLSLRGVLTPSGRG